MSIGTTSESPPYENFIPPLLPITPVSPRKARVIKRSTEYQDWLKQTTPREFCYKSTHSGTRLTNLMMQTHYLKKSPPAPKEYCEICIEGTKNLSLETPIDSLRLYPSVENKTSTHEYKKLMDRLIAHPSIRFLKQLYIMAGIPKETEIEMIYSLSDLIDLLSQTHHIKHLSIQCVGAKEGKSLFIAISRLKQLESLSLADILCEDFEELTVIKNLIHLKSIKIHQCLHFQLEHISFMDEMENVETRVINNKNF